MIMEDDLKFRTAKINDIPKQYPHKLVSRRKQMVSWHGYVFGEYLEIKCKKCGEVWKSDSIFGQFTETEIERNLNFIDDDCSIPDITLENNLVK